MGAFTGALFLFRTDCFLGRFFITIGKHQISNVVEVISQEIR
jgi:hypothetical protein